MPTLEPEQIASNLGFDGALLPWLQRLQELGDVPGLRPIEPREATDLLHQIGVNTPDTAEVLAAMPDLQQNAALWWLVERCHFDLTGCIGDEAAAPFESHHLPEGLGAVGALFWLYVFLAAVADVRQWHAAHGIPDDVSWDTLSSLGSNLSRYKQNNGHPGLDANPFFALAFRGVLFHIGRLSYIPYRLCTEPAGPLFWFDEATVETLGCGFRPGDPAVSIHVPADRPLATDACDASLQRAVSVFASHCLPGAPLVGTCTSWLLDPQLAEYLSADSNIVRFQRRFQLVPGVRIDNEAILSFLRNSSTAPDTSHRETTLQRAVTSHIAAGKDWHMRTGWLDLSLP